MSSIKEKMKAVSGAIAAIEKQFGKGAIMPLDGGDIAPIDVIPTGSVGLDVALGVGGLPRGRVIEIYGPESSGKTTLTLQAIAHDDVALAVGMRRLDAAPGRAGLLDSYAPRGQLLAGNDTGP